MDTGLYRTELAGLAGLARLTRVGGSFSDHPERSAVKKYLRSGFVLLPAVLIVGFGGWMLLSGYSSNSAESEPVRLAAAIAPVPTPVAVANVAQDGSSPDPATLPLEAIAPIEAAPVDALKISSQSWRRGGLGSKALITFTLRNGNDYAVKDIELFCSFARRDGSHLTDRTRMIHDIVSMKSRKTFARMHVGFVNVNADQAKCSLVAASRI